VISSPVDGLYTTDIKLEVGHNENVFIQPAFYKPKLKIFTEMFILETALPLSQRDVDFCYLKGEGVI
jgi:hypothetical protein